MMMVMVIMMMMVMMTTRRCEQMDRGTAMGKGEVTSARSGESPFHRNRHHYHHYYFSCGYLSSESSPSSSFASFCSVTHPVDQAMESKWLYNSKQKWGIGLVQHKKNIGVFLTQSQYQPNKWCPVRNRSYILKNINSRIDFSTKILIVPMFGLYPHKTHKFLSSLLFGESIPSCPERRGGTEQNDIILPNSIIKSLCHCASGYMYS